MRPVATFSLVARDPDTGDLGVATASKFLAVGAVVPYAIADVAAIATQSYANTAYGPRAIDMLLAGVPIALVDQALRAGDEHAVQRQYGVVDADGGSITFTGDGCHPWAGGVAKPGLAAQGNLLAGPQVIDALVAGFESHAGPFPERLLAGLLAADRAGGDARGRQSAALLVVREEGGYGGFNDRYVDLRVDDDPDPVPRLQGLLALQRLYFGEPRPDDVLPIEGEVAARLLALLRAAGHDVGAAWDAAARAALAALAGRENVEERLLEGDRVDRVVLEHLERVSGG
ncbi:MAG: DUF1028 domain-containing protein [Trueperaceae bacterium]